ncbi:MAG: hypothetical protein R2710_21060 [Acidimicrobiales bacterium]
MHEIHRLLPTTAVTTLAGYLDGGGGRGVDTARRLTPAEVIRLIEGSGLRGRGGAGFPTGKKWRTLATLEDAVDEPIPVVVNAAEGEPGTFKDRALLRLDPYSVIEGAAIAAHAIGSNEIIIAIKASFREETLRLMAAIDEINAADWMPGMTVRIVDGPSEYLFGEETALLEVIDGRPPLPRIAPRSVVASTSPTPTPGGVPTGGEVTGLADWSTTSRPWRTCPGSWPTASTGSGNSAPRRPPVPSSAPSLVRRRSTGLQSSP